MLSIHRHVLRKALDTIMKYWYLWPLGLFASLLGNGSEFQMLSNQYELVNNQENLVATLRESLLTPTSTLVSAFQSWSFSQTIVAIIILAAIAVLAWLSVSSVAGLIIGINKAQNGEQSSFKELLITGTKKFWPTLGYLAVSKIATGFVIAVIFAPIIAASYKAGYMFFNSILVLSSIVILIPAAIVINFITKFAMASFLISETDFTSAWKHAWYLFKNHWLIVIEQAVILLAINLIIGLLLIVIFFIIFGPFFLLGSVTAGGFFPFVLFGIMLVGLIIVVLGSGLASFQYSAWTIMYLQLNENRSYTSKIVRLVANLFDRN